MNDFSESYIREMMTMAFDNLWSIASDPKGKHPEIIMQAMSGIEAMTIPHVYILKDDTSQAPLMLSYGAWILMRYWKEQFGYNYTLSFFTLYLVQYNKWILQHFLEKEDLFIPLKQQELNDLKTLCVNQMMGNE
jgi:hypothetical protein